MSERDGTAAEEIYRQLRSEIVRGVLRPNEALVEVELAERLGVSRTPIRESLQRLANDGLIVSRRRRWAVYEHTLEEIREIYEVRAALEGHAARLAAQRATAEDVAAIRAEVEDPALATADSRARVEANERFHDMVDRCARNERLVSEILRNRLYSFNYRLAAAYTPDQLDEAWKQHGEIVEAIGKGEADRAAALSQQHVEYAFSLISQRMF